VKGALQYQKYCQRLGQEPSDEDELATIEKAYAAALAKYGRDFGKPQGWAAKHLNKPDPTIADIQEASKIDHLRPYYRVASNNVHANPKGVFFKLGLVGEMDILLAGPSDVGIADPGHATAISLVQISTALVSLNPTFDNTVLIKIMLALTDEIGAVLLEAHRHHERKA